MDRELTPEEIAELLPAYALDAVDDDERARDRRVPGAHPDARDEVTEFQVAASMLAHAGGPPPEGVWEKLESIITESSRRRCSRSAPRRRPRVAHRRPGGAVEPAVAVVRGGRGGGRTRLRRFVAGRAVRRRLPGCRHRGACARTAATAPGARHAVLTDPDGNTLATAVVTPRRQWLPHVAAATCRRGSDLSAVGITRTGTISLGVLGREPEARWRSRPRPHRPRASRSRPKSRAVCR